MGKLERNFIEPSGEMKINSSKKQLFNGFTKFQAKLESFLLKKGFILLVIGFLLGRALILAKLTPFSLPFFAAVYLIKRDRAPLALIGLVGGAATISISDGVLTLGSSVMFLIIYRFTERWIKSDIKVVPAIVFFTLLFGNLLQGFIEDQNVSIYEGIMAGVEAGLGSILTLIFQQSIPLLLINKRRQPLKTEEIICLIIMLASIMTGTIGWSVYDLSVEHIISRFLVLLFAYVAGATVGSTVGVVTGLDIKPCKCFKLLSNEFTGICGIAWGAA